MKAEDLGFPLNPTEHDGNLLRWKKPKGQVRRVHSNLHGCVCRELSGAGPTYQGPSFSTKQPGEGPQRDRATYEKE